MNPVDLPEPTSTPSGDYCECGGIIEMVGFEDGAVFMCKRCKSYWREMGQ